MSNIFKKTLSLASVGLAGLATMLSPASSVTASGARGLSEPPVCGGTTDYSRPAPKHIQSRDLRSFSVSFSYFRDESAPRRGGGSFVPLKRIFPGGWYTLTLEGDGNGARFSMSCRDGDGRQHGDLAKEVSGKVAASTLSQLDALIRDIGLPRLNGYYKSNSALGNGFNLKAVYASGETLNAGAEGGYAVMPKSCWDEDRLVDFFCELARRNGTPFHEDSVSSHADEVPGLVVIRGRMPAAGNLPAGHYDMQVYATGKGGAELSISYRYARDDFARISAALPKKELRAARDLIAKTGILGLDGYRVSSSRTDIPRSLGIVISYPDGTEMEAEAFGTDEDMPGRYWDENVWQGFFFDLAGRYVPDYQARLFRNVPR